MGPSTIPHGEVLTSHSVLQVLSRDGDGCRAMQRLIVDSRERRRT